MLETSLRAIEFCVVLFAALWTYYRFFREGKDKPRIEFYMECDIQGPHKGRYVTAFTIHAINKGRLEYQFETINLRIRGIQHSDSLNDWEGRGPLLEYPAESCSCINIIPEKHGSYFVRPGVHQRFSYVTSVPESWAFFIAHLTFKYPNTSDDHTTEKAFQLSASS